SKDILKTNEAKLIKIAERLLETEKIEGDEFIELMKDEAEVEAVAETEPAEEIIPEVLPEEQDNI
ncbi:MAG: hypothetical protein IJC94_00555, partial [Oscillospiraceae bacterium]|nr:hypothetical protein [Oscillospiraceae bacterium]